MRKTIKLAVVAALALGATSAFATNGDNLIATGAKARAMGGVGIATSFGAESSVSNPALLNSVKSSEFSGSITAFMPDVAISANNALTGAYVNGTQTDSKSDFSLIPEFAYASRINNNLVYGVSVTGTAGMGVENSAAANVNLMTTELALMKIAVPVSYQMGELSLGVAPILQYGTLDIRHNYGAGLQQNNNDADIGYGYEIGVAYDATSDWTIGAAYKSELAMSYKNVLSRSITSFGANTMITSGDKLTQPAEIGVGASYSNGANTFAVDYKRVEWGSADGYADFGWEDQDVYSIGYEYATKAWSLRAGYNYAKSPVREQTSAIGAYKADVTNFFNLSGFPGIVESHYTAGAGYNMSDDLSLDLAVVYAAEEKNTFSIGNSGNFGSTADSISVVHSQLGVTVGATYKF